MEYLLVALTLFQFIFRIVGLQGSALYVIANPYVLALPFIVFWLGSALAGGQRTDRNLFLAWIFLLAFPSVMLRNFTGDSDMFFLFLRGLQFFWGPLLMVPALLGIFRMIGYVDWSDRPVQRYIAIMAGIAGSVTLFELLAVHIIGIQPRTLPWVGSPSLASMQDINPFRPWGLPSYPQPNSLIMAYLFWLSVLWGTRGLYHKLMTFLGVLLSGSTTGQIALAGLSLLAIRRPLIPIAVFLIPLLALVAWSTATNQYAHASGAIAKLDLAYLERLSTIFSTVSGRFLGQISAEEILFGTNTPTMDIMLGYSHDWAYLDVFYAFGLVGLAGYIVLFAGLLYLALPSRIPVSRRIFFVMAGLALNFHYGTLNYYIGQFVFCCIVALRLSRGEAVAQKQGAPAAEPDENAFPVGAS